MRKQIPRRGTLERYLLFDKPDESRKWFEKSAEFYFKSKQVKNPHREEYKDSNKFRDHFIEVNALQMMNSAVLSENIDIMEEISEDILVLPPYKSLRKDLTLEYVNSLAMFILNSPEFNPSQINKFKDLEDKYAKKLSGASLGVAQSLLAIHNKDDSMLMEGVNQVLKQFFYRIKRSKERPICEEAIMLLKLAEIKGMEFDLGDIEEKYQKYVPRCMFDI